MINIFNITRFYISPEMAKTAKDKGLPFLLNVNRLCDTFVNDRDRPIKKREGYVYFYKNVLIASVTITYLKYDNSRGLTKEYSIQEYGPLYTDSYPVITTESYFEMLRYIFILETNQRNK